MRAAVCRIRDDAKGFAAVKIIIIVTIIALLAAIVIPSLLRVRINANETACVTALRSIAKAATAYMSSHGGQFPPSLAALGDSALSFQLEAGIVAATGILSAKNGYYYIYTPVGSGGSLNGFWVSAEPASSLGGNNYYYIDESGVVCKGSASASGHASEGLLCPADFKATHQ